MAYQPKTEAKCSCKPGVQRDNCPNCEGTGWAIDFVAIRAKTQGKWPITVQVLSMVDGSVREVVANVTAESEQAAVDKLYDVAKDEKAYRYLGHDGVLTPSCPLIPAFTTRYAPGEWWARS